MSFYGMAVTDFDGGIAVGNLNVMSSQSLTGLSTAGVNWPDWAEDHRPGKSVLVYETREGRCIIDWTPYSGIAQGLSCGCIRSE